MTKCKMRQEEKGRSDEKGSEVAILRISTREEISFPLHDRLGATTRTSRFLL